MGRSILRPVSVAMVFILVFWVGVFPLDGQNAPAKADADKTAELIKQLREAEKLVRAAEKDIPVETFEPRRLYQKIGPDPARLFAWVRDNTYLVPYRGVLRNAQGVLVDRLGNSLDRSLLLAELFGMARKEVRLCRGKLKEAQIDKLLSGINKAPEAGAVATPVLTDQAIKERLLKYGEQSRADVTSLLRQYDVIRSEVQPHGEAAADRMRIQNRAMTAQLGASIPEAASASYADKGDFEDYWWVQVKEGQDWVSYDPALPQSKPGESLTAALEHHPPKKLPAELFHKVQVRVVIERAEGDGRFVEEGVLSHDLVPSEVFGLSVAFHHYPPQMSQGQRNKDRVVSLDQIRKEADKLTVWVPILTVGKTIHYDRAFDDSGRAEDYVLRPEAGISGSARDLFTRGTTALGQPQGAPGLLTAEWLEFTVIVPGRPPHKIRRQIFDLLGPDRRTWGAKDFAVLNPEQRSARALALLGRTDLLVFPCQLTAAYLDGLFSADFVQNSKVLVNQLSTSTSRTPALDSVIPKMSFHHGALYQFVLMRSFWNSRRGEIFISRPNILAFHSYLGHSEKDEMAYYKAFDIVENFVDVVPWAKQNPFLLRLEQGVADTNVEALLFQRSCDCTQEPNTAELYLQSPADWRLLKNAQDEGLKKIGASPDAVARIIQELKEGQCVIAPSQPVTAGGKKGFGWWRVDPRTGQVLGLVEQGWGVKKAETAMVYWMLISEVALFVAWVWCLSKAKTKGQEAVCMGRVACDQTLWLMWVGKVSGVGIWVAIIIETVCRFV